MKKKIIAMIFVLALCVLSVVPAFATDTDGFADEYYRINDAANILSDSEKAALLEKLDEISLRQKVDVTVVTIKDLQNYDSAQECADDIYDYCKYGYGQNKDGIMLLISMENRDWAVSTRGYGITAFTDAGIDYIVKQMKSDLSDGNYAAAFTTYADKCDEFITRARSGEPYDKGNLPREPLSIIWLPISIAVGVDLAFVIVGSMKRKLKTVHSQAAANSYVRAGSLAVTESSDMFLYNTVTRTEKAKSSDSDSGSSTHTSSSGATHGGSSGKF